MKRDCAGYSEEGRLGWKGPRDVGRLRGLLARVQPRNGEGREERMSLRDIYFPFPPSFNYFFNCIADLQCRVSFRHKAK